jgi:2-oxoglutarate dehydrogenase E1 component
VPTCRSCCRFQIAPFPYDKVAEALRKYGNAEVVWSQEECKNMGAWSYVAPRLQTANKLAQRPAFTPKYVGRAPSASPAAGAKKIHDIEQAKVIAETLTV